MNWILGKIVGNPLLILWIAAAAFAAGGGNNYLLLSGLLGVLFTSLAMTRLSFACDTHVVRAQLDNRSR